MLFFRSAMNVPCRTGKLDTTGSTDGRNSGRRWCRYPREGQRGSHSGIPSADFGRYSTASPEARTMIPLTRTKMRWAWPVRQPQRAGDSLRPPQDWHTDGAASAARKPKRTYSNRGRPTRPSPRRAGWCHRARRSGRAAGPVLRAGGRAPRRPALPARPGRQHRHYRRGDTVHLHPPMGRSRQ